MSLLVSEFVRSSPQSPVWVPLSVCAGSCWLWPPSVHSQIYRSTFSTYSLSGSDHWAHREEAVAVGGLWSHVGLLGFCYCHNEPEGKPLTSDTDPDVGIEDAHCVLKGTHHTNCREIHEHVSIHADRFSLHIHLWEFCLQLTRYNEGEQNLCAAHSVTTNTLKQTTNSKMSSQKLVNSFQ